MPKSIRPSLTADQIKQLKSDIKKLSRIVAYLQETATQAKYPVRKTQNAFARELGFTSLSNLSTWSSAMTHHSDFKLIDWVDSNAIFSVYDNIEHNGGKAKYPLSLELVESAIEEMRPKAADTITEPHLELEKLHSLINESDYKEHHYIASDGFPGSFKIDPKAPFFNQLAEGDHFIVLDGNNKHAFTVTEFNHIYTAKKVFEVLPGRWHNIGEAPFCSGSK